MGVAAPVERSMEWSCWVSLCPSKGSRKPRPSLVMSKPVELSPLLAPIGVRTPVDGSICEICPPLNPRRVEDPRPARAGGRPVVAGDAGVAMPVVVSMA
jgi:hypothetical protein